MKEQDIAVVDESLRELFGVTGPEYKKACHDEWEVRDRKQRAEEAIQERFRPHWKKIMSIVRRELNKRGIHFTTNHCGYQRVAHVDTSAKEPSAVGIGHIEYNTMPYIHIKMWLGNGIKLEWDGGVDSASRFSRYFDVLLATLDGFIQGVRTAGGKDCPTCHMPKLGNQYKSGMCQRCKECNGSLWL